MPKAGSSIRVRNSGKYEARYRGTDGKVRGKIFATEKEAKAFLIETRKQVQDKTWSNPELGRQTFASVAALWLAHERERGKARPTTINGYERTLRGYAEPNFGTRQIASVTSSELETWVAGLTKNGKAVTPRTKRSAFFPVQATFSYAARHRIIRYNPCADVRLPENKTAVKGHFLSREEVAALAAQVAKTHEVYGLLVRFAAGVGLRASETTGLRVGDLLLDKRQVNVARTVKKAHPADWIIDDEMKSKRSKRRVPILDDALLADLTAYLASHPRHDDPDAPLWPGRDQRGRLDYGKPGDPRYWNQSAFYRNVFRPAVTALGLPDEPRTGVRWHDLRHTCISQWLQDGNLMYEVSRWAGHASYAFTDSVYAHVADEPDYTAALERTRLAKTAKTAPVIALPTAVTG